MRALVVVVLVLIAASAGWRYREPIIAWLSPGASSPRPKPIVFDNGTVRDIPPPTPRALATAPLAGGLRKCVKGSQTTYTNFDCPPGFKEKTVSSDRITVLEGQGRHATPSARAGSAPGGAQRRLQDALDLSGDSKLRERMMERAIESGSK